MRIKFLAHWLDIYLFIQVLMTDVSVFRQCRDANADWKSNRT